MAVILLVDDSKFMRDRVDKLLVQEGYTTHQASNGRDAVEIYPKVKPQLVIMDITMPDMDGITAVEEMLKVDPQAKIVMLSAMGQKEMVLQAVAKGAKYFLVKPFEPSKVLEVVKKFVGKP